MTTTHPKVFAAICAVQGALAKIGIAKERYNQGQKFNFRGIDDVYAALAPLLSEHKLCIIPRFIRRVETERKTSSGGVMIQVSVEGTFTIASAEDGSTTEASLFGEAMDSGDKATNKAMSAAYKYLAFQLFCIPLEGEDNDACAHTPPPTTRAGDASAKSPAPSSPSTPPATKPASVVNAAAVKSTSSAAPVERKDGAPPTSTPASKPAHDPKGVAADLKALTDAKTKPMRFAALMAAQKKYAENTPERKAVQDLFAALNKTPSAAKSQPAETPSSEFGRNDVDEPPPLSDEDIPFLR